MADNYSIKYIFQAIDKFSPVLKQGTTSLKNFQYGLKKVGLTISSFNSSMKKAGTAISDFGHKIKYKLGVPATLAMYKVTRGIYGFETAMNGLKSVLDGISKEEFVRLREQAILLGKTTRYSASEAAAAQHFLAMAGFEVQEIYEAMPATLDLAASANMDLGSAANIVTNIMAGFGKEAKNLGQATDVVARAVTRSNMNVSMLGESMKYAAAVSRAMGIRFEEATAFIGLLGNAGMQGSIAGTALKNAIIRLEKPSKQSAKVLKYLGISTKDASGKMKPLYDIINQLNEAGASGAAIMEIFGLRAGPAIALISEMGADKLKDFTEMLGDAEGVAKRMAETRMQGLPGAFLKLRSAVEGAMLALGDAGLTGILTNIATILTKLTVWFTDLPTPIKKLISITLLLSVALAPLLITLGLLIKSLGFLAIGFKVVSTAFVILRAVMIANPFGILLLAIYAVITNLETIYGWILKIGDIFAGWFGLGGENEIKVRHQLEGGTHSGLGAAPAPIPIKNESEVTVNVNAPKGALESVTAKHFGGGKIKLGNNIAY